MIQFKWDNKKAANNLQKHSVSFEEASTAFNDPFARIVFDPDHSEDEDRFILLGMSTTARLLVVCHCYRDQDEVIRIISARKADKQERKQYGEFL